ncbi:MAG: hypothetical protein E4H36_01235 [Spirochaetales bacterium]|nr:MAG: hypothetical protein E4H36_01235 [Spirochaetales bacterium]
MKSFLGRIKPVMRYALFLTFFLSVFSLHAENFNAQLEEDLLQFRVLTPSLTETGSPADQSRYLGYTPDQAFAELGAPLEIYPERGKDSTADTVVFYYGNHLYLYWYGNRVWQIRADRRYEESLFQLFMNAEKQQVLDTLGVPFYSDTDSVIYRLPDRGYPVKMRLFFNGSRLSDLYIYRGDF